MTQATKRAGDILLVNCNPDDEELALRALARGDLACEVTVARDGGEALEYLFGVGRFAGRDARAQPALVLLDLTLREIGGLEVLRRIRADPRTRSVPVVVLTASGEDEDIRRSYECGANSYVRKPVNFAEFTAAVSQLGAYWLGLNRLPRNVGETLTRTVRSS